MEFGKIVGLLKCLACKHKDMRSSPKTQFGLGVVIGVCLLACFKAWHGCMQHVILVLRRQTDPWDSGWSAS